MIPIDIIVISKLDPPYDKNGKVTPVTGTSPTTTIKLSIVWNAKQNDIPNDNNLPNGSFIWSDILTHLYIIIKNKLLTIITPINPNSSLIIENIKSVSGSGK